MEDGKKRKFENGEGSGWSSDQIRLLIDAMKEGEMRSALVNAAESHADVANALIDAAGSDPQNRRVFVRGLQPDVSNETLRKVFSEYGEIEDCQVVRDKQTGKSRGYAFLRFASMEATLRSLADPSKPIDGRMAICQLACLGPGQGTTSQEVANRKVFIGNVHPDISSERILAFFSSFGDIVEGPIGYDAVTKKSKGFAILVYKTVEGARKALEEPNKSIDGHQVFCKVALDRSEGSRDRSGGGKQTQQQSQQSQQSQQQPLLQHHQQQAPQQQQPYQQQQGYGGKKAEISSSPAAGYHQQQQQQQQQQQGQVYASPLTSYAPATATYAAAPPATPPVATYVATGYYPPNGAPPAGQQDATYVTVVAPPPGYAYAPAGTAGGGYYAQAVPVMGSQPTGGTAPGNYRASAPGSAGSSGAGSAAGGGVGQQAYTGGYGAGTTVYYGSAPAQVYTSPAQQGGAQQAGQQAMYYGTPRTS